MINKARTVSSTMDLKLNSQEQSLYDIYSEEYADLFENIFNISEKAFMSTLTSNVSFILGNKAGQYSKLTQAKVQSTIKGKLYMPDLRDSKKIREIMASLGSNDNQNVVTKLEKQDYHPHCSHTSKAYHTCGNELLRPQATNIDYVICLQCKMIFKPEQIHLYCRECKMEYYSSLRDECEEELQPATWEIYHCRSVVDTTMRCPKCREFLLYNSTEDKVECPSCEFIGSAIDIPWKCSICKSEFYSRAKAYSPLIYKPMKVAIKKALMAKIPARPDNIPCCTLDPEKDVFRHKKECQGILYLGELNGNKIAVCSECQQVMYFKKSQWYCPKCGKKFKVDQEDSDVRDVFDQKEEIVKSNTIMSTSELKRYQERGGNINRAKTMKMPLTAKNENKSFFPNQDSIMNRVAGSFNKNPIGLTVKQMNIQSPSEFTLEQKIISEARMNHNSPNLPRGRKSAIESSLFKNKNINLNINVNININNFSNMNFINSIKKNIIEPPEKFNINDFTIENQIGEGTFGKIYSAIYEKNGQVYALKKMYAKTEEELENMKKEYNLVMSFFKKNKGQNFNIIKIYGVQTTKDNSQYVLNVLMELARTDWEKEITERSKTKAYYSEGELLDILKKIIRTMAELQKNNITHRDIKPQNILFVNNECKLCDFGEAKVILYPNEKQYHSVRGTELYMSPILFNALKNKIGKIRHDSFKSDVFSLGYCLILAGTLNFRALYDIRELKDMDSIKNILTRYLIARYSYQFVEILLKMIEIDEKKRMDFIQLEKILRD